jgi:DNA replication protein DnaC
VVVEDMRGSLARGWTPVSLYGVHPHSIWNQISIGLPVAAAGSALFQKLIAGDWIEAHDNLIVTGPTGVGKSWLASALGHKACRDNRSVLYQRVPKLFGDLALARGDGRYSRLFRALGGVQLLILDDWGLEPLTAEARHDLLEILEERYGRRATIVTSQLPIDKWHDVIGDPTYADAILDRLVHNAHRIDLSGDSLRRSRTKAARPTSEP